MGFHSFKNKCLFCCYFSKVSVCVERERAREREYHQRFSYFQTSTFTPHQLHFPFLGSSQRQSNNVNLVYKILLLSFLILWFYSHIWLFVLCVISSSSKSESVLVNSARPTLLISFLLYLNSTSQMNKALSHWQQLNSEWYYWDWVRFLLPP